MARNQEIKVPRLARTALTIPSGVELKLNGNNVAIKGPKGSLELDVHASVIVAEEDGALTFKPSTKDARALTGTMWALVNNMITGANVGFQKKLQLIGVGYRAQAKGNKLNLSLGFSHPVEYLTPEGIAIETPSQTEIVVSGADKQLVGQVAADIRKYRPPEPYKGKGVRYADEYVVRKEAKKK